MKILRCFSLFFITVLLYGNIHAQSQKSLARLMSQRDEYYFSLNVQNPDDIQAINSLCSVDGTDGSTVVCYANPTQYDNLLAAGYEPFLLTPPSLRHEAKMYDPHRGMYDWDSYLTYPQFVTMMEGFPATAISGRTCTFLDLGTLTTTNHRRILGVRINNGEPNGKPKFLYTSTMHGDEVTGMILMLRLIDELCTCTDARIVNLVNSLDIFIFPCTNPDGTYYGGNNTVTGARRNNGNNVDLNRHFPDFDDGAHPDGASSYQNEAQWMMDLAQQYLFTMGANYHGGAEVVNYPWDTYQPTHPDDAWWRLVSTEYVTDARAVSSSYMTDTYSSGITNGYSWYTITGSRQDYMNYYGQCRELTLECSSSKTPNASQLPNFWNYNHNSMLAFMEQCLKGVHGVVRDANTNQPIEGVTVTVQNHDALGSWVTSHAVGDFHRPIKGGSYTFKFTKEGYCSETVDVTITDGARVDLEVLLTPSGGCPVDCYYDVTLSEPGSYILGYHDGNNLVMPTNNSGSTATTTVAFIPNGEGGYSVEQGEIDTPFSLTSTGTEGQYYISYNGYYLTRSTSGWGSGNKTITWSTSQSNNNRWTINSDGISQTTSGWSGTTTYYLFYNNGAFYTGTSNANNITFYQEGDCPDTPVTTYTINVTANPNEGGSVTGGGTFEEGETCTVSATASNNYTFVNWTENGNVASTNATYTFIVNSDRNLVANFSENPPTIYTVTVSANPTEGGNVTGGGTFEEGQSCTVSAIASSNYTFENWTENGDVVSANASYTFTVNGDRTLVANFTENPPTIYIVSVSANPQEGGNVTGGGNFEEGQSCTVSATTNSGYLFDNWTENGIVVSSNTSYTFTVNDNHVLVANFSAEPLPIYNVSVSANPNNGGSVTGDGAYEEGQSCTVTATAHAGYTFTNWTENGNVVSNNASFTFTVTSNRNLIANFTINTYAVSVSANPSAGGTVTGGGTYEEGQSCTVTATAHAGYTFTNWTENGNVVSNNASFTFTVTSNRNLIANFTINTYTVSVSANPSEGGTVTGDGTFTYGQTCTITASVSSGYTFVNWTENGSYVSSNTSYTFTVTDNHSFVAHFTENPLPMYTVSVIPKPQEGGTVRGAGSYQEGQTCIVSATPATGYTFVNWTEDAVELSTNASYTFTVTSDRTLVANFAPMTYTISATVNPAEGGEVFGASNYAYGLQATVKVIPNEEYIFLNWTENGIVVSEAVTYSFTVTGSRNLVANLQHVEGVGEQATVGFDLYPNPVSDKLTVEATEAIDHIEIFNIAGAMVYSQKSCGNMVEIHTADLPAGIYVVRMTTLGATEVRRFVKK